MAKRKKGKAKPKKAKKTKKKRVVKKGGKKSKKIKAKKRVVKKKKQKAGKAKKAAVKTPVKSKKAFVEPVQQTLPTISGESWTSPAWGETEVGIVEHYFNNIEVAAILLRKPIKVGDKLHFKGHTTDFSQKIDSMQVEHDSVLEAPAGSSIGIRVKDRVREHDLVYRIES